MSTSKRPRRFFQMPDIDQPDPEPNFQHNSDEFVIPSKDEEGESVRMWCCVPGSLHAWLGDIVNSRKFPFLRDGDLVRYGIYLACVQLSKIDRSVPYLEHRLNSSYAISRRRASGASILDYLNQLQADIEKLVRAKAWGEIVWILRGEKTRAEKHVLRDPYWGQRWVDGLRDRFADTEALAISKHDLLAESASLKPSQFHHDEEGDQAQ
jgi:hypothetical protein